MGCDAERAARDSALTDISIHAARMGCDQKWAESDQSPDDFNPRSPNGLRLVAQATTLKKVCNFNPRSPNGLRLKARSRALKTCLFQSTQPEWAATNTGAVDIDYMAISIHAARMGCDYLYSCASFLRSLISIHAARMGCDVCWWRQLRVRQDCNSRSPHWHRKFEKVVVNTRFGFQSTQPEWAATGDKDEVVVPALISIHAARMGCDKC